MSEYGIRIKNIAAGSIFEANIGVRENLDTEDAMLSNSLLLDFLLKNGLEVWNGKSTRDVIGIDFKYGGRSYEMELQHLEKIKNDGTITEDRYHELLNKISQNKDKYRRITKEELRIMYYTNGVNVTYKTHNRNGKVIKKETIHYKMLFRSPGKAKKGVCMFICDRLYEKTLDFMRMGVKLPQDNAPIVEIGAYSSLIASGIVGRIKIDPENILVIPDHDSYMTSDAVSIETNERNECIAVKKQNYRMKNTMWDGQGLIDSSVFPAWGDGYVLLRQHMTKLAAFHTNLREFFMDYYGEKYETAEIKDYWGNAHKVKDIKLITTENAVKWIKFGVSYDYWCKKVRENGSLFGVVKTSHVSKLGNVQRMSYQMVNALEMLTMDETMIPTIQYVRDLKNDDDTFLEFLERNKNFSNDYEVLIALANQNRDFMRSEYFCTRRRSILQGYLMNIKSGRIIQNADNLVIVGSPYAMLLASVGENPESDPTFDTEDSAIQCWTSRFEDGEFLAEFRSPFNSRNNMGFLHNHHHEYFDKYFNFGKQIIAVNMNHTSFQDRNNGSDQDSDSIYVTNSRPIVAHAKICQQEYPTIVNNIPKEKNNYSNTPVDYALIDNRLSNSQGAIGESSNLAQIALSYTYNFDNELYNDCVCILSVLAQIAIDSSKRTFDVDVNHEIGRIKTILNVCDSNAEGNLYPEFWKVIQPQWEPYRFRNGEKVSLINQNIKCPMNELQKIRINRKSKREAVVPNEQFFIKYKLSESRRKCKKVEDLIEKYSLKLFNSRTDVENDKEGYFLLMDDFDQMVNDIRAIHISNNYLGLMSYLIDRCLMITPFVQGKQGCMKSNLNKNRAILMKTLYEVNPKQFLQCFSKKRSNI